MADGIIRPCGFCGVDTSNPHGFCSDTCYESYEAMEEARCPNCGDPLCYQEECMYEDDDEPADIDTDFGYDPYSGGPEQDDMDCYSEPYDCDLWNEC